MKQNIFKETGNLSLEGEKHLKHFKNALNDVFSDLDDLTITDLNILGSILTKMVQDKISEYKTDMLIKISEEEKMGRLF